MGIYRIVKTDPKPVRDEYTRDQLPEALATLRQLRQQHGRDAYVLVEIAVSDKPAPVDGAVLLDVRDAAAADDLALGGDVHGSSASVAAQGHRDAPTVTSGRLVGPGAAVGR